MNKMARIYALLISVMVLLLSVAPVLAEGEEKAATQPAGIGILILLMGLLALLLVGGTYLTQNGSRPAANGATPSVTDEDEYSDS